MSTKYNQAFIAGVLSFIFGIPACLGFVKLAQKHPIILIPWGVLLFYIYLHDYINIIREKSITYTLINLLINLNGASCVIYVIYMIARIIKSL